MEYTVVLHKAEEGGYWADVPALEGCFSQGETVEECLNSVREAVESHILALQEDGRQVPADDVMILSRVAV